MANEILEGRLIELASTDGSYNSSEGVFLISVLNQPDRCDRIITEEDGEKFHKTIIGYPFVAKLKNKNSLLKKSDFGGHEMSVTEDSDGTKHIKFDTTPIGTITDSWIEERTLPEYDDPQKCILVRVKLWTTRFPSYFEVFQRLYDEGKLGCSWEISVFKMLKQGIYKILKEFEFFGLCGLGSNSTPAVQSSGCLEVAEYTDCDVELANALEKDIANLDIDIETINEEDKALAKEKLGTPIDSTELAEEIVEVVEETATEEVIEDASCEKKDDEKEDASCGDKKDKKEKAESEDDKDADEEEKEEEEETASIENPKDEVASLTDSDIFRKLSHACRKVLEGKDNFGWGYITHWFPEEHSVWFKEEGCEASALDYLVFSYTVENDEVVVSEPSKATLTVAITDVNNALAEKDQKIAELAEQISVKDEAVIKACENVASLKSQIAELTPYKEKFDAEEAVRIKAEIAECKKVLKDKMLKTKLFTNEDLESPEIAELIDARDEKAINGLISNRYIASLDDIKVTEIAEISNEVAETTPVSILDSDEINEDGLAFMNRFFGKKK